MDNPLFRRVLLGVLAARAIYETAQQTATPQQTDTTPKPPRDRRAFVDDLPPIATQRLFGVSVSELDLTRTVERIIHWAGRRPARVVVTTNLDHVMKLRTNAAFQKAYDEADLVTPDGMPFVWLSKREETPLKGRVTGSDLITPLMTRAAESGRSVFFFGSTLSRLHTVARQLKTAHPTLDIKGVYAPPFGFERDSQLHAELVRMLRTVRPDIILVALGAPKQELWSTKMADSVRHGVFVNIGGGLDFLSGEVKRAPAAFQSAGLEWLWRALTEPLRLGPRYTKILIALPSLLKMHKRDRARYQALLRRKAIAVESERHYRDTRTATREAERDRAFRATLD
ncbi:MAG: WecB/TagA/CpsF family glycosyltransferase [Pseudomonadota bacterium]